MEGLSFAIAFNILLGAREGSMDRPSTGDLFACDWGVSK